LIDQLLEEIRANARPIEEYGTPGVYFLFDGAEMVYIGSSSHCEMRVREHARIGRKQFDAYSVMRVEGDRKTREQVESGLIALFVPKYNDTEWNHRRMQGSRVKKFLENIHLEC
jgi:hypothetical protein